MSKFENMWSWSLILFCYTEHLLAVFVVLIYGVYDWEGELPFRKIFTENAFLGTLNVRKK